MDHGRNSDHPDRRKAEGWSTTVDYRGRPPMIHPSKINSVPLHSILGYHFLCPSVLVRSRTSQSREWKKAETQSMRREHCSLNTITHHGSRTILCPFATLHLSFHFLHIPLFSVVYTVNLFRNILIFYRRLTLAIDLGWYSQSNHPVPIQPPTDPRPRERYGTVAELEE